MRWARFFKHLVTLITLPLFIFFQFDAPAATIKTHYTVDGWEPEVLNRYYDFIYDDILDLLTVIEENNLEYLYSFEELYKINQFLAYLALKGGLSNDEVFNLEDDIQELLYEGEDSYYYLLISQYPEDVRLCRSWITKKCKQVKKFVKKHKKAIVIGTLVVVAVTAVVLTAGAAAGAVAGAAGTAGAAASDPGSNSAPHDEEDSQDSQDVPSLNSVINDQVADFKELVVEDHFLESSSDSFITERARELGAFLAHETLESVSKLAAVVPDLLNEVQEIGSKILQSAPGSIDLVGDPKSNYESIIASGHEKIDKVFSTDQADYYTSQGKESEKRFLIGILPFPGVFSEGIFNANKLAEAGKAADRAGFTRAGRSLMKHGYREGSIFPKPIGNPDQVNQHGQKILEEILHHSDKKLISGEFERFGKVVDIYAPGIGGARYTAEGEFIGFLEP